MEEVCSVIGNDLIDDYRMGRHRKGDNFDIGFCHRLIDFFKENIPKYGDWAVFDFKFSPTESYEDIGQFYNEVAEQGYKVNFVNIPESKVDELIDSGKLFLFQLYNKDYSGHSFGKKNLHTLYWDALFSPENLKESKIRLNGYAELFFRPKSDIPKIIHKKGSILVRRTDKENNPIPDAIYYELFKYKIGKINDLSEEAERYLDCIVTKEAKYDIVKDRRYTENKLYFHVPLTFNARIRDQGTINRMAIDFAKKSNNVHYIGIDRGERNLIYAVVIDRNGNIVEQRDFNLIENIDFHRKLDLREKERKGAIKSWDSIKKIDDLKEGFISKVVHEISEMILKYNAVVIMEDLNFGFKRARLKIDKQVYQKFEKMLIDKLNYLVFKDKDNADIGSVLNAYQFTDKCVNSPQLSKQSGIIFFIPAAYTSSIDPTTGFVNHFSRITVRTAFDRRSFIQSMKSIKYCAEESGFKFGFDYRDFGLSKFDFRNEWTVSTREVRSKYSSKDKDYVLLNPTADLCTALERNEIPFLDGQELKDSIVNSGQKVIDVAFRSFMDSLRMRFTDWTSDNIKSPVKNNGGYYYISGETGGFPKDADANGAFNIALKGKLSLEKIDDDSERNCIISTVTSPEWIRYVQKRCTL